MRQRVKLYYDAIVSRGLMYIGSLLGLDLAIVFMRTMRQCVDHIVLIHLWILCIQFFYFNVYADGFLY
jgi:hypothetical protein